MILPPPTALDTLVSSLSLNELRVWSVVVTINWFVMLHLTLNVLGSYTLAVRRQKHQTRSQATCRMSTAFGCILMICVSVSWLALGPAGVFGDILWLIPITTLAFVISCIYTTLRLGRWPGLSGRHVRRLALPDQMSLNFKWQRYGYTREHLVRYERLRDRRLGRPPAPRVEFPDDIEPPTQGGRPLLP
ncbi:hypothetical protein [Thalassobaculum sp.]|uniref:hypothetical protein n=1 Tax=Thalassobaculum sp. TaxID=2022740 RepID=UPI0032EEA0D0